MPHPRIDLSRKPPQGFADLYRIRRIGLEPAQRLGQSLEIARGARANLRKRRTGPETLAALHDQFDQRLAALFVALHGQDVPPPRPPSPQPPPPLLSPPPRPP